ncbi:MAG: bifunctional phosphopantothenoylcysteine decarboxylase/phosphopantothenate--cysteine ligase CoaBC [Candidatus Eremiobacteraeota bacterium]|nr:bifunctional phosphopantothenoylcysteine decarboxylase/phosphopantothenate--cysteine ligase CoaBC [Candidatus Eremiobacteraeota bacterium]
MNGARVLLVVSGGIAAYKAAALTSTLVQKGASVDVILTADAERFIAPLTFAALTARPVYSSLWDAPERIPHIRLVREAEVAIVAPATANIIAKLRAGIADDLATTALLAARIPVLIAPAMNAAMYENEVTVENIATLKARGYEMIEPDSGFLAEREHGVGRLASEERLLEAIEGARARRRSLLGKRVLITAGPSQEPFDPVRFIGNASTGATGIALADEAARRGAEVTLLLGPTLLAPPYGVRTERFATAQELLDLALRESREIDLTIAAAAVADWRPSERSAEKRKKSDETLHVDLERTPDVLAAIAAAGGSKCIVGFAAETNDHEAHAREKMERKSLDAIVVNDVRAGAGFGLQENGLVLLVRSGARIDLGRASKRTLAGRLFDALEPLLKERT